MSRRAGPAAAAMWRLALRRVARPQAAPYSQIAAHVYGEQAAAGARPNEAPRTANFGYRTVPEADKARMVGEVFSHVARSYDTMNDLMSAGLHRLWKDPYKDLNAHLQLVHSLSYFTCSLKTLICACDGLDNNISYCSLQSWHGSLVSMLQPFPGMKHLDVAGGTGDVAFRIAAAIQEASYRSQEGPARHVQQDENEDATEILVCDINEDMLEVGRQRARAHGLGGLSPLVWLHGNAEELPLPDRSMDGYTIAFGIRNVTRIDKALREAFRVLKRGGRFLCLELSHVQSPTFRQLYDMYSFAVIPTLGELVAGDRDSYQYLVESIRKFPPQEEFVRMIEAEGFQDVNFVNLAGGVVAIHSAFKL